MENETLYDVWMLESLAPFDEPRLRKRAVVGFDLTAREAFERAAKTIPQYLDSWVCAAFPKSARARVIDQLAPHSRGENLVTLAAYWEELGETL